MNYQGCNERRGLRCHCLRCSDATTLGASQGREVAIMTERKSPAQERLDGAGMFHLLIENVKDFAIFMLDPEGRIVSWNTGAERTLGYSEPEIIGQPFSII